MAPRGGASRGARGRNQINPNVTRNLRSQNRDRVFNANLVEDHLQEDELPPEVEVENPEVLVPNARDSQAINPGVTPPAQGAASQPASRGSGRDGRNRQLSEEERVQARKRKLAENIEVQRAKLRALEEEHASLNQEPFSSPNENLEPGPSAQSASSLGGLPAGMNDVMNTMAKAFAEAIKVTSENSNSSLVNRLVSDKETLTFSGNPVEWPRFKRAFEHSSSRGAYTDRENAVRLCNALRGDARVSVESLMISTDSAEEIMEALERRYGDKGEILRKVINTIKKLPRPVAKLIKLEKASENIDLNTTT